MALISAWLTTSYVSESVLGLHLYLAACLSASLMIVLFWRFWLQIPTSTHSKESDVLQIAEGAVSGLSRFFLVVVSVRHNLRSSGDGGWRSFLMVDGRLLRFLCASLRL